MSNKLVYGETDLRTYWQMPEIVKWSDLLHVLPTNIDKKRIELAYRFASFIHANQKRLSGEPFIHHPLAVAYMVSKLDLGEDVIIAALLHDVVEDNVIGIDVDVIERYFGKTVAFLVDSMTNFREATSRFIGHKDSIEDLRKLLAASIEDVRALIIRLSDKVHNAWTYSSLPKEKQIRLAKRALSIYAPLAHFVGLHMYRRELQDIAFRILYPEIYRWLKGKMQEFYRLNIKDVLNEIYGVIKVAGISKRVKVRARHKSLWSTYQKALRKINEKGLEGAGEEETIQLLEKAVSYVYDKIGVMILTDTVEGVYKILDVLHFQYEYIPEEFDDYIKTPKKTGYRAIHTVIKLPVKGKNLWVEVQLKTFAMHEYNEFGPASHLAYKLGGKLGKQDYKWIRDFVAWTKDKKQYKLRLFQKYVFVFTPQGEIIELPKGATPLDLLYKVQKDLLFDLLRVLVNDKVVPFDYKLKTGDVVSFVIDPLAELIDQDLYKYAAFKETKEFLKKGRSYTPIHLDKLTPQGIDSLKD